MALSDRVKEFIGFTNDDSEKDIEQWYGNHP